MKQTAAKQCAKIHPFLPVQRRNVRISNIDFINAVLYVLENGCKRRALPERFGNWFTVYARFRRWSKAGANALLAVRCCVETSVGPTSSVGRLIVLQPRDQKHGMHIQRSLSLTPDL